ncbi:MAG: flagellar hook-length control protein FliK [Treponema sp.]|nr:flagellar hook-length control protein FliK [Treponema sp.]
MQAIVSDIIVNQAIQTGNLQVSQVLQNNSSPQTSFADLLNSVRSGQTEAPEKETELKNSYENSKPQEVSQAADDQKANNADRTEDKKQTSDIKDGKETPKADEKQTDKEGNVKKNSFKDDLDSKPKLLKNEHLKVVDEDSEEKADPKTKLNSTDIKNSKKILDDKNLNKVNEEQANASAELAENAAAVQNASSQIASNSQIKTDSENLKNNELTIDLENIGVDENQDSLLQNKLLNDEKVYALDKDSKIIVRDQRTAQTENAKSSEKSGSKGQVQVQFDNQNNATITMELAEQTASENILSLDNQTAASEGSNFQAMLSNQIQANAPEFVKAGSLILQDNNKGTINLVLHPDDLGNVKIHLSMDGKTVSAHITVNTKEALEVFKDNAQTLREAFAKSGFDTSSFDVSYNGNSQNDQNQTFEGRYDGFEYWAKNAYGDSLGGETDGYIQDSYEFAQNSEYSINIVA